MSRQDLGVVWDGLINLIRHEDFDFGGVVRPASLSDRRKHRKMLTSALISRYIKAVGRDARPGAGSIQTSERYKYQIQAADEIRWEIKLLNRAIWRVVIQAPQVVSLEEKGRHIIRSLFAKFFEGSNLERLLPDDWREYIVGTMSTEERARLTCDFIASMTDNYAQQTYGRLFLPHQGSVFELL